MALPFFDYRLKATLREAVLGTAPLDTEVYKTYLTKRYLEEQRKLNKEMDEIELREMVEKAIGEELGMLRPDEEKSGKTGFRRNAKDEPIMLNYMLN